MDFRAPIQGDAYQQQIPVFFTELSCLFREKRTVGGDREMDLPPPVLGIGCIGSHNLGKGVGADLIKERHVHEAVSADEVHNNALLVRLAEYRIRIIQQPRGIRIGEDVVDEGLRVLHREGPSSLVHLIAVGAPEVAILSGVQCYVEQPRLTKGNQHVSLLSLMSLSIRSSRSSCTPLSS